MNSARPEADGAAGLPDEVGETGFFLTHCICHKAKSDGTGDVQVSKGSGAEHRCASS